MAGRPLCWTAHLVLMLVAAARCSAGQQPQYSGSAPEQLRTIISRAVAAAAEPIVAELGSQRTLLDGIVSRLKIQDAHLKIIQAVNSQDASLDSVNVRLDALHADFDTLKAGQATLNAGLNELSGRLAGQDASLDTMKFGLDTLNDRLGTLTAGQNALNASLNALSARLVAALPFLPRDCSDLPTGAGTGVYTLQPGRHGGDLADAYCDMDTAGGGWTVIQRRADILPRQDFFLDWASYREGFGNISGEFWWGLEKVWLLTSSEDRRYELRVDLEGNDGKRSYALYQGFAISSEKDGYRLAGGNYSGDAEDGLSYHIGHQFSTKDRDQDLSSGSCAQELKGGWWYGGCSDSNLNAVYGDTSTAGVWWWRDGWRYYLKTAEMKVRPARV